MTIDKAQLLAWAIPEAQQDYSERDCIIYALGLGIGANPLDLDQLRYVYESGLTAFPSMPLVLATGGRWASDPATGIDYGKVVHAEQSFTLARSLPTRGSIRSYSRVTEVIDKGADRGAIVTSERVLYLDGDDAPVAVLKSSLFCRGDGGFGDGTSIAAQSPTLALMPEGAPDLSSEMTIPANLALLYRLSGDLNPLHSDPAVAGAAGFRAPILQGLCTFGLALRAAIEGGIRLSPSSITGAGVRFTGPVYPGEAISTDLWQQDNRIAFRMRVPARDTIVLDRGWISHD